MINQGIINPQRYPTKIFTLEYLLALGQNLPFIMDIPFAYFSLANAIVWILKYKFEGLRMNAPLLVIPMITAISGFRKLTLLLSVLAALLTYHLKVYKLPKSQTSIGYKTVTSHGHTFSLFYPANTTLNSTSIRLFGTNIGQRMHEIMNKDPGKPSKMPKVLVEMASHYYTRLRMDKVILNSGVSQTGSQFQLIIISHQLGFNSLYSLAREFVGSGYIVMLVDHPEAIKNIDPDASSSINKQFRISQLVDRFNAVEKALDFILSPRQLTSLLGDNVRIDSSKVHIMGHSFGATTALYSAFNDPRITGVVICLDPCLFLLDDSFTLNNLKLQFNNNTLFLLAEDYYKVHYDFFENDFRVKVLRNNCNNLRVLRMLGSNHANFSQLALFTSGQFQGFKVTRNGNSRLYFQFFLALSYIALQSPSLPMEADLVHSLLKSNPSFQTEIGSTFRSILDEEHSRLVQ